MALKLNFTKRALKALPVPESGRAVFHDSQTRGLLMKIESSGHRTFAWYKFVHGYPAWKNLGVFPDLSIEEARRRADELNAALAKWRASGWEGPSPFDKPASLTLDGLVDEYITRHLKDHAKRPESAEKTFRWRVERYLPSLRTRIVASIRHEEVAALHRKIGEKYGHRTANVVIQMIRTLYGFARRAKLFTGENPGQDHMLYREESRTRFIEPPELPKLWQALSRAPNPDLRDFVNLSLWCGARKMDTLSMRWSDVSIDGDNKWTIPDPKSRVPYTVPLTDEAVAILRERRERADESAKETGIARSPFVFPSHARSGHVTDVKKAWKLLLKDAKLDYEGQPELKLRIHDLRRSYGSYLAVTNASMPIISKALGHADAAGATKIYARLNLDPVRQALETAQAAMRAAINAKPGKPKRALLPAPAKRKAARRG
jgi:integrase